VLLFSAGFDSPVSLIGLGLQLFLDNPDQARLLREEPELADLATEEILRCEPPVQIMFRAARTEVTVGEETIPEGSILLGLVASALRDSALVEDPERFDITRPPSSGLSFGGGAHYCLGAHLARLSATVLFPMLLRRFPELRPAGQPTYRAPGVALRGLESLPVTLTRPLTPPLTSNSSS
jgi:cytochrome P450